MALAKLSGYWQMAGGPPSGLTTATALLIIFRQRYPRWWFAFSATRFGARVSAYAVLLTDRYPLPSKHLVDSDRLPERGNRSLPVVTLGQWLLRSSHYIVLFFLGVAAFFAVILAWFAILVSGQYPRALFDFVVGVSRWSLRVTAYAFLLVTVAASAIQPALANQPIDRCVAAKHLTEEGHVEWAEQQSDQIEQMGLANYLTNQTQSAAG